MCHFTRNPYFNPHATLNLIKTLHSACLCLWKYDAARKFATPPYYSFFAAVALSTRRIKLHTHTKYNKNCYKHWIYNNNFIDITTSGGSSNYTQCSASERESWVELSRSRAVVRMWRIFSNLHIIHIRLGAANQHAWSTLGLMQICMIKGCRTETFHFFSNFSHPLPGTELCMKT